jgi:hypothetical protein
VSSKRINKDSMSVYVELFEIVLLGTHRGDCILQAWFRLCGRSSKDAVHFDTSYLTERIIYVLVLGNAIV